MTFQRYICAVDISSSKIAACVASVKKGRISDIFFETAAASGIKKGSVINSIDLTSSLSLALRKLKSRSGIPVKFIYAVLSGQDIIAKKSRAIIPLAERGNRVITSSDVRKVNEQARILGSSLEEEILHCIPAGYTIDSKSGIANPLGLYSHKLEADVLLTCARLSSVQNLVRVVAQAGYEMKDLYFSGITAGRVLFKDELRRGTCVYCDIGSDITELMVFEEGLLKDIRMLELGGDTLTGKLQDAFKIPFDLAEEVKRSYGSIGDCAHIPEDKEVLVKKSNTYKPIKQRLVAEVLTASARPLCERVKETASAVVELDTVNTFIVSGRTLLLEGFIETLEHVMGLPVRLARVSHPAIISALHKDEAMSERKCLPYLNVLGAIAQALDGEEASYLPLGAQAKIRNPILRAAHKVKEVYQEYF